MNEVENTSFEDIINKQNIDADRPVFGKWAEMNKDYFSNPQIIEECFFSSFGMKKIGFCPHF